MGFQPHGTATATEKETAALIEDTAILSKPWHFKGQFQGVRIGELPADYCEWALKNMTKLQADERRGCEIVLRMKQEDCAK
jgi:hypothetical protein